MIDGIDQKYTINENETASFRADGDVKDFSYVKVDDEKVNPEYYTVTSGSTIITFTKDFMNSLSVGEHKIDIVYNNGNAATTNFVVAKADKSNDEEIADTTEDEEETEDLNNTSSNPATGDNISLYGMMLAASLALVIFVNRKFF